MLDRAGPPATGATLRDEFRADRPAGNDLLRRGAETGERYSVLDCSFPEASLTKSCKARPRAAREAMVIHHSSGDRCLHGVWFGRLSRPRMLCCVPIHRPSRDMLLEPYDCRAPSARVQSSIPTRE